MSNHPDLEARLQRFLVDEAPHRVPDRLIAGTRERLRTTRQRRLRFRVGEPFSTMVLAPVVGVVAILAVVAFISALLASSGPSPRVGSGQSPLVSAPLTTRPSSSPFASRSPSPSPLVCATATEACVPELEAGPHSSANF